MSVDVYVQCIYLATTYTLSESLYWYRPHAHTYMDMGNSEFRVNKELSLVTDHACSLSHTHTWSLWLCLSVYLLLLLVALRHFQFYVPCAQWFFYYYFFTKNSSMLSSQHIKLVTEIITGLKIYDQYSMGHNVSNSRCVWMILIS